MSARQFVVARDYEDLRESIEKDPQHKNVKPIEFISEPKTELYVWEDEDGAVFYYRISRELRIDIQFRPGIKVERTREGLKSGLEWLMEQIKPQFRAIVFDSVYSPLRSFSQRRLGFKEWPDLRKVI